MWKILGLLLLTASAAAVADEGLWTLDQFPTDVVRQTYGVTITPAWLDHVRLSTVRLANCTGSFVSPWGLMLTNHHCIESCLEELSSKTHRYDIGGFVAGDPRREQRCVTQVADVLLATEDVTAAVAAAVAGLDAAAANAARKKVLTTLEEDCERDPRRYKTEKVKCQGVKLYDGAQYFLYKYKRYDDVRLVFAPEADIAGFGGDPDNYQFPRWRLDFAALRAYEHGAPARTPNYFKVNFEGPKPNELLFAPGHPGSTQRYQTRARLDFDRDVFLPNWLLRAAELRGRFIQFGKSADADDSMVQAPLNSLENSIKIRRKLLDALHDDAMLARISEREDAFRARAALPGEDPWRVIAAATARERALFLPYTYLEGAAGFNSSLFRYARALVRGTAERAKPNAERLREYVNSALPRLEQQLLAELAIDRDIEVLTLSFSLQRMREWLGPDHPVVRRLLAHDSPDSLAARLVGESKLDDPAVRKQLWEGGQAAVAASQDPMIELARGVDPEARAVRAQFEDTVEGPLTEAERRIAAARFQMYGTKQYPDATFTLRLNYGKVQGWVEGGVPVEPYTRLDRLFERATGVAPFKIPDTWLKAKSSLDLHTPFCLATNNDIIGGNSGSPLLDVQGRMVGLLFDGNIHSIAGHYWFDPADNRAIAVHMAVIRAALERVYGAEGLLSELGKR